MKAIFKDYTWIYKTLEIMDLISFVTTLKQKMTIGSKNLAYNKNSQIGSNRDRLF